MAPAAPFQRWGPISPARSRLSIAAWVSAAAPRRTAWHCLACRPSRIVAGLTSPLEDQLMTAYVLVIMLAAGHHHQPLAVGYPDQGACLVAAERVRHNKMRSA
jgi:hypothetical protein